MRLQSVHSRLSYPLCSLHLFIWRLSTKDLGICLYITLKQKHIIGFFAQKETLILFVRRGEKVNRRHSQLVFGGTHPVRTGIGLIEMVVVACHRSRSHRLLYPDYLATWVCRKPSFFRCGVSPPPENLDEPNSAYATITDHSGYRRVLFSGGLATDGPIDEQVCTVLGRRCCPSAIRPFTWCETTH